MKYSICILMTLFMLCLTSLPAFADTEIEQMGEYLNVDVTEFLKMEAELEQFDAELASLSLKIDAATNEYVTLEEAESGITGLSSKVMLQMYMQDYLKKYNQYVQDKLEYENTMLSALEYEYALAQADTSVRDLIISTEYVLYLPSTNITFTTPVNSPYVTSEYGNRLHPVFNVDRLHTGIDLVSIIEDYNVVAAADGIVTFTGYSSGYGNYVMINHGDYDTLYAHLDNIYVQEGTLITQGAAVGVMGTTGISTGVHLHFEIRDTTTGTTLNPRLFVKFNDSYDLISLQDVDGPATKRMLGGLETVESEANMQNGECTEGGESTERTSTVQQMKIPDVLIGSPYLQMSSSTLLQLIQESRAAANIEEDGVSTSFGLASTEHLELAYAYVVAIEAQIKSRAEMQNTEEVLEGKDE